MNSTSISVSRSIVVDAPQDRCFETFVNMTSWWPARTLYEGDGAWHAGART